MKIRYMIFTILFTCLIGVNNLNAICEEDADLVSYDLTYVDNEEEGLKVKTIVYDIDEALYIKVTNDYNNETSTYDSSSLDENGYIIFDSVYVFDYVNYTIDIYSKDETCSNKVLRTIKYKTNKYNSYSTNDVCKGNESTIDLCSSFYDTKDMSEEEFLSKVKDYKFDKSALGYIKRYYLYVLIPFLIGVIVFTIRLIIFKRGNKNA